MLNLKHSITYIGHRHFGELIFVKMYILAIGLNVVYFLEMIELLNCYMFQFQLYKLLLMILALSLQEQQDYSLVELTKPASIAIA